MTKLKKCYRCFLVLSICECFNSLFYSVQISDIEENVCSNNKYRTIIKIKKGLIDTKEACLFLKKRFGCGGTFSKGQIQLQGKHKDKILSEISNL